MCDLCDENGGEYQSCQDCGRMICFDATPSSFDVIDRAYVTNSGDLFCARCGSRYDIEEEEAIDDEYGWDDYTSDWYDADMDFENEESNGRYIGDCE